MKYLVTGGAGFIGSHVCERLLHAGHAVWAFDDLNTFYDPQIKRRNLRDIQSLAKPFEFVLGDITNRAALDELFGADAAGRRRGRGVERADRFAVAERDIDTVANRHQPTRQFRDVRDQRLIGAAIFQEGV